MACFDIAQNWVTLTKSQIITTFHLTNSGLQISVGIVVDDVVVVFCFLIFVLMFIIIIVFLVPFSDFLF